MKIVIPNDSQQTIGGGWSFRNNLTKGVRKIGSAEIVEKIEDADIVLIAGATMVSRDTVGMANALGKKIVLRIDNIPRNSRNRNTGTSRLRDFAAAAHAIVYQSQWAKNYIMPFVGKDGPIIYNGIDTNIFNEGIIGAGNVFIPGDKHNFGGDPTYLYSRYNRDETKRWEEAWYEYQMIQREQTKAKLVIVGNFSPEQIEYNFDFFFGEHFEYLGIADNEEEMAKIYRGCDYFLAVYYNDCYSNTYQEALACGCELWKPNLSGGTEELIRNGPIPLEKMTQDYLNLFEEVIKK